MIRKLLLGTVALAALSTAAFAADLPSRRAPPVYVPPPIPIFSWTGFYMGGQVGYGFGRDNINLVATPAIATRAGVTIASVNSSPHGVVGGAHVGYNFAGLPGIGVATGGLVLGVEADIDGTDYQDTVGIATLRQDVQGSARARIGIAVDRALFYATGGAAFTQFHDNYAIPAVGTLGFSHTRVGYTVGGGAEYAITTQWSLRAEYRYSDFGTYSDVFTPVVRVNRRETVQRVQVGFSYKFDTIAPVPVVARY